MDIKIVAKNRTAHFEYFIQESFEAGIALKGSEIKSIRGGQVSIQEARICSNRWTAGLVGQRTHCFTKRVVIQTMILKGSEDYQATQESRDTTIMGAEGTQKGVTIIPVKMYLKTEKRNQRLPLRKAKSFTTNARKLPKKIRFVIWTEL